MGVARRRRPPRRHRRLPESFRLSLSPERRRRHQLGLVRRHSLVRQLAAGSKTKRLACRRRRAHRNIFIFPDQQLRHLALLEYVPEDARWITRRLRRRPALLSEPIRFRHDFHGHSFWCCRACEIIGSPPRPRNLSRLKKTIEWPTQSHLWLGWVF